MTVEELIVILQEQPFDAEIRVSNYDAEDCEITYNQDVKIKVVRTYDENGETTEVLIGKYL